MPLFGQGTIVDNGGGRSTPRQGGGIGRFIETISPAIPIVGGVVSNILSGINERKARLYNSPINQVKRLREAGLPLAAGSNITAGGGVSTKVNDFGTTGATQNIGASITRQIDRKRVDILGEEIRSAKANADIRSGEAKWLGDQTENYLGSIQTNQAAQLDFQKSIAESNEVIQRNQSFITSIDAEVKESLREKGYLTKEVIARIDHVLAATGLTNEQKSSLEDQRQAREVILNLMRKNGMNMIESLTYMLLTKFTGSGQ